MKSYLKMTTLACVVICGLTGSAFAGNSEVAADKLSNVIQNSVPANARLLLLEKLDVLRDNIAQLKVSIAKLDNVAHNSLPQGSRDVVNTKISALKVALANDITAGTIVDVPVPKVQGLYCAAACTDYLNAADPALEVGLLNSTTSELIAKQATMDKLASAYACTYGAVSLGCETSTGNATAKTCQVACVDYLGKVNMSTSAIGQGGGLIEAEINARQALAKKYNCDYGSVKVTCE